MKKRFFALSLIVLLLFAQAAALAGDMQNGSMYVNTANGRALRFRTTKSTRGTDNILCEIPYGTKVYVLDWDGTWAHIQYNGKKGYVVQKHLTIARPKDYETVVAEREAQEAAEMALLQQQAELKEQQKQQEAELKAQKKQEEAELKEQQKQQEAEELLRKSQIAKANAALDQSRLKDVEDYDVTVVIGVVDMTAPLYQAANLSAEKLAEYGDGARLVILEENKDWARIYDGASDQYGYMLRADLVPDLEEDVLLED